MPAIPAPLPPDEQVRLAALKRYHILDTPDEAVFDDFTRLASYICGTPVSAVTFVDETRQWFKSRVGFERKSGTREEAFCAHAILGTELMVVPDALADPRFATNPFVASAPHIRFYAGAPLITPEGQALGTLCVLDLQPRDLTREQRDALKTLSRHVIAQLELRRRSTDLLTALERMQDLDRLKSEFITMASHELRTPLTSIRGGLQLLAAEGPALNDDRTALVAGALRNTERLIRMTNDILDLSRLDTGGLQLRLAPCRVEDVIGAACDATEHLAGAAGRVRTTVAPALPTIQADTDRLVQALVNLISNAIKYTPAGTPIEIEAERDRDTLVVRVSDRGPGLSQEELGQLFQPFHQLERSQGSGGTGLGLVITRGVVEQHGGTLSVTSKAGCGTVYTITLPLTGPSSGPLPGPSR